jgi:hypothetical protein
MINDMNKLKNHVDKLQMEMKAMWCVNKLVMETQFAKEVEVHNKIVIQKHCQNQASRNQR